MCSRVENDKLRFFSLGIFMASRLNSHETIEANRRLISLIPLIDHEIGDLIQDKGFNEKQRV